MGDTSGKLSSNAIKAAKKDGDRKCPADLSGDLHKRINDMVTRAHRVLKCRHYSLYDIRIDANEQPYILEAALFCSFSPLSVIPAMAQHAGRDELKHPQLFHSFLERAAAEKQKQRKGMALRADPADRLASTPTVDTLGECDCTGGSDSKSSEETDSEVTCHSDK